jgi:hypothetical protein
MLPFKISNLAVTGSDAQHQQQNILAPDKPIGCFIEVPKQFKSTLFITENDLVVCLSNAQGISIVPFILYLTWPKLCSKLVGKFLGNIISNGYEYSPMSKYKSLLDCLDKNITFVSK